MVSTEHIRGIEENNTSSIQNGALSNEYIEKARLVNEVHDANNNIDHHHLPKEVDHR
jgi:hypothetical protein